jgi:hypothetical protein
MSYLADDGPTPTPLHLDDGDCHALCGAVTAGPPSPSDPIGWAVCARCVGISLRAEADRIDPQGRRP